MTILPAENLPREARALLIAIAQGESDPSAEREGISPYFILYGGGSFDGYPDRPGYYGFPEWAGRDNSHAAGRYQFQPSTWKGIVPKFGKIATPDFRNPGDQDWGAWFLAQNDYKARAGLNLGAQLRAGDIGKIGEVLQPTWTSMSNATFIDRYKAALALVPAEPIPVPPVPVPPIPIPQPPIPVPPIPPPPEQPPIIVVMDGYFIVHEVVRSRAEADELMRKINVSVAFLPGQT